MKRNLYVILIVLFILSACQPGPAGQGQADTATPIPTPTATPIPVPARPDESALEQAYSDEQILTITNGDFQEQEEQLAEWWGYWQQAVNHPFAFDSQPTYLYYWDENGKAGAVLIQPGGTYLSRSFYIPVSKDGFRFTPPTAEEGFTIPEGFGPLEVSGGEKYVLAWRTNSLDEKGWVRLDENGEIAEIINKETGHWQPERFYFLTPELKKGCEYNLIRPDHYEEDMDKLLEKERSLGLTAEDAFVIYNYKNFSQRTLGTPLFHTYEFTSEKEASLEAYANSEELFDNRKITCSYMPTKDGHGIYILGIPIRRIDTGYYLYKKDETWGWFHFGIDPIVHNIETWPDKENYFEEEEYFNITQNQNVNRAIMYVPFMLKGVLTDGTVQIDDYSVTNWDPRYKNIVDLIKKGNKELGGIYDTPGYKETSFDPQDFLSEFSMFDHTRKDYTFDRDYILANLEKIQTMIIPLYGIGFGEI
jgi:hypothetical protein